MDGAVAITGPIRGADFAVMTDGQLELQRESINRLLNHVKYHCPIVGAAEPHGNGAANYCAFPEDES